MSLIRRRTQAELAARRKGPKRRSAYARLKAQRGSIYNDVKYKEWLARQACIVRGCLQPAEVAHVGYRGMSRKCPDRETLPICTAHHREGKGSAHGWLGKHFWAHYGLDRDALVRDFNERYEREQGTIPA